MVWFSAWAVYGSMCSRLNLSDDNDWPLCFMATHCIQHKSMHWGITVPEEMKVVIVAGHKRGIISVIIFWEWFSMEVICLMYSLWIAVYDIDLWWFFFFVSVCMWYIYLYFYLWLHVGGTLMPNTETLLLYVYCSCHKIVFECTYL